MKKNNFRKILGLALLIAGLAAFFASASPDGLEFVAKQQGFSQLAKPGFGIFSDYSVNWLQPGGLSTALAGAIGVLLCLALGSLIGKLLAIKKNH